MTSRFFFFSDKNAGFDHSFRLESNLSSNDFEDDPLLSIFSIAFKFYGHSAKNSNI